MTEHGLYLTKSDFKIARECPAKLYYAKLGYPSLRQDNPFLETLKDGGFMVEKLAKLLCGEGRELARTGDHLHDFQRTKEILDGGNCTLFEATVVHGALMARVDILRREGNLLHLIEVKSKLLDSEADDGPFRGKKGGITSMWRPYLEDVAFQVLVLRRAFPTMSICPWLCVVDKAKRATPSCTFDKFLLEKVENCGGGPRTVVHYLGDPEALAQENLLDFRDISAEVAELEAEVEAAAERFALSLAGERPARITGELAPRCKKCEYRLNLHGEGASGFRECWGTLAQADPHLLDLAGVHLLPREVFESRLLEGDAGLASVPIDGLKGGVTGARQEVQIAHTAAGTEYISKELPGILSGHAYPLHFLDFEDSACALPYYAGMHPYEKAAFQWSCHTLRSPDGPLEHAEWLNTHDAFPNFAFARSLKECLGATGTIYVWSHHERTVLKTILEQMGRAGERDPELKEWLSAMVEGECSRIVDLWALAKVHYYYPTMRGSWSIKHVLPAAWAEDPAVRTLPEFAPYERFEDGVLLNPYDTLPPLPFSDDEEPGEAVREGMGAVRTYQQMMFGGGSLDLARRETYRRLLLQYCKLDTAAMVIIWRHWKAACR